MTTLQGLMHRYLGAAWLLLVLSAGGLALLALDRSPPFESLSYTAMNARPGSTAYIDAVVQRDKDRLCDVTFSRFFIDAKGTRWEVTPYTHLTAKGIAKFDEASQNRLRLPIPVPALAAPGPATFIVSLDYRCNITHWLTPIDVVLVYKFEVLP